MDPMTMAMGAGTLAQMYGAYQQGQSGQGYGDLARMQEMYYKKAEGNLAPWMQAGKRAMQMYESKVAAGPGEFRAGPGYGHRLREGTRAIERSGAARGLGGATAKALATFGQNIGSAEYDKFVNRYYQGLQPLANMANMGLNATQSLAQMGMGAGATAGQFGAAGIGAESDMYGNYANILGQGANNMALWQMLQPGGGGGGSQNPNYFMPPTT